jgi:hypothetical protein
VLRLQTERREESWQFRPGIWESRAPDTVIYRTQAHATPVSVRTTSTLDFDGCMKVELDLLPGEQAIQVDRLWLEIPLKDQEAPLFHYCAFEGMRRNYAGATPRGGTTMSLEVSIIN